MGRENPHETVISVSIVTGISNAATISAKIDDQIVDNLIGIIERHVKRDE